MIVDRAQYKDIRIIAGNSHPGLCKAIAERLGVPLSKVHCFRRPNREVAVIMGESVREADVYIVQTNYSRIGSLNDNLFELLELISACKAGSAAKITAGKFFWPSRPILSFPASNSKLSILTTRQER